MKSKHEELLDRLNEEIKYQQEHDPFLADLLYLAREEIVLQKARADNFKFEAYHKAYSGGYNKFSEIVMPNKKSPPFPSDDFEDSFASIVLSSGGKNDKEV